LCAWGGEIWEQNVRGCDGRRVGARRKCRPSALSTNLDVMVWAGKGASVLGRLSIRVEWVNYLIRLFPECEHIVSHLPPLDFSRMETINCSALLWRSWRGPSMV
jgi:hypothetical protein